MAEAFGTRGAVEEAVKKLGLNRARFFESSKQKYAAIIKQIEKTFVIDGGPIHWANIERRFSPRFERRFLDVSRSPGWYLALPNIVPEPDKPVYALFEDSLAFEPKYWLYEAYLPELVKILYEIPVCDFYVVSKKYNWLISEDHEETACFVGDVFSSLPEAALL